MRHRRQRTYPEASVTERHNCAPALQRKEHALHQKNPPFLSLDLSTDEEARMIAEKIAERTGKTVKVTDEQGDEVHRAAPPRRNVLIVLQRKQT